MNKIEIMLPSIDKQNRAIQHLDLISERLKKQKTNHLDLLSHYDELRSSILNDAFTGNLVK